MLLLHARKKRGGNGKNVLFRQVALNKFRFSIRVDVNGTYIWDISIRRLIYFPNRLYKFQHWTQRSFGLQVDDEQLRRQHSLDLSTARTS